MKFRSRFAVVGTLLAVALALLVVLPALARDSKTDTQDRDDQVQLTISVHAGSADSVDAATNAQDTLVLNPGGGSTVWVAANDNAYNQVFVQFGAAAANDLNPGTLAGLDWSEDGHGIRVRNVSSTRGLQRVVQKTVKADPADPNSADVPVWANADNVEKTWEQWQADITAASTTDDPITSLMLTRAFTALSAPTLVAKDSTDGSPTESFYVVASLSFAPSPADRMASDAVTVGGTPPDPLTPRYILVAGDNDEIQVTATGTFTSGGDDVDFSVSNSATLKVDASAPQIAGISPVSGTIQRFDTAGFGATITDPGSGLRTDAEDDDHVAGQAISADGDGDGITRLEPLSDASGAAVDIAVNVNLASAKVGPPGADAFASGENSLSEATSAWRVVDNGYSVRFQLNNLTGGVSEVVYYAFRARDRVNNVRVVGYNGGDTSNLSLKIDADPPGLSRALAGIGYNSRGNSPGDNPYDTPNLNSIKVEFSGGVSPAAETLDPETVEVSDFRVESEPGVALTVTEVIHPNIPVGDTPATTNHVVYLVLADPLAAGAKPTISIVGTITDVAGNRLGSGSPNATIPAIDETRPEFGVTVAGDIADRTAATGTVTIRVAATEPLQRTPTLRLVTFEYDAGTPADEEADPPTPAIPAKGVVVATTVSPAATLLAVRGVDNTWEVTATRLEPGLYGVWVEGTDPEGNDGSTRGITVTGTVPAEGDVVDLTKLTLFEIDDELPELTDDSFVLTPSSGEKQTQTINPFIRINFAESTENSIGDEDSQQEVEIDTHNSVTLTTLMLRDADGNSTDLLGTEGRVNSESFLVSLSDLVVGEYTLLVNGTDELGNTYDDPAEYDFEVAQRKPFSVSLWPGNNLISVPGEPMDPSIDAVLPSSHPATAVLAYDPTSPVGPWLAATREAGGSWSGPLTEIRAGHGYWLDTSTFQPLSTRLQERGSGEVPPTYPLTQGWNLVGVVDPGLDPKFTVAAGDYFASIEWAVAYTFSTENNAWTKITAANDDAELESGQGVWVWVEKADVLAP